MKLGPEIFLSSGSSILDAVIAEVVCLWYVAGHSKSGYYKNQCNLNFHREEHVSTWQLKCIWALAEIARKSKEVSELLTQTGMLHPPCERRAFRLHPASLYTKSMLEQHFRGNMLVTLPMP